MIQDASPRLDAWDRYARVLAGQIAALEGAEPDLERFHQLARERAQLAREIDQLGRAEQEDPASAGVVARIRDRLEDCRVSDRAVLDRIAELRGETQEAVGEMRARSAGRRGYTRVGAESGGQRVDVRS